MHRHLFVMDPIGSVDIDKDSTFVLMLAAQERGDEVWACGAQDVSARDGYAWARCRPTVVQRVHGDHARVGDEERHALGHFDVVWMRKDPPFDMTYIAATYALELAPARTRVVNRPDSLRAWNEKTSILKFPDLAPPSLLTRRADEIREFQRDVGGAIVIKPLGFSGGNGVFALHPGDLNTRVLLEMATDHGRNHVLAQAYLPEVRRGDKRVILVDGDVGGAILRIPPEDDLRGNIHIGATVQASTLTPREQRACERLGPALREAGHLFVGIDLIGERLTEINVTSPTGLQEIADLIGDHLEHRLVEAAIARPTGP